MNKVKITLAVTALLCAWYTGLKTPVMVDYATDKTAQALYTAANAIKPQKTKAYMPKVQMAALERAAGDYKALPPRADVAELAKLPAANSSIIHEILEGAE